MQLHNRGKNVNMSKQCQEISLQGYPYLSRRVFDCLTEYSLCKCLITGWILSSLPPAPRFVLTFPLLSSLQLLGKDKRGLPLGTCWGHGK